MMNLEMPTDCYSCMVRKLLGCKIANESGWLNNKRDDKCPLKEQEVQKFFLDESGKITPLPVVVQCKDCKWRGTNACFCKARDGVQDDWFYSEGERKTTF